MTYMALRDELASILCTDTTPPCSACTDAAYRIMVKRRSVRRALIRFAREEADCGCGQGENCQEDNYAR